MQALWRPLARCTGYFRFLLVALEAAGMCGMWEGLGVVGLVPARVLPLVCRLVQFSAQMSVYGKSRLVIVAVKWN